MSSREIEQNLPVAVIGAGPVGLAAAAHLLARDEDPLVFEAGAQVSPNIRELGHVRLFSPWQYLVDRASAAAGGESDGRSRMGMSCGTKAPSASDLYEPKETAGLPAEASDTETDRGWRARVLFLCTHNSARSQMAEGILRHLRQGRVEAHSAGTIVTRVHPLAIAAMAEKSIDISDHRSKHVEEFSGQAFDFVVTVCDNARESCPIFPGAPKQIHWSIADPSAVEGDVATKLHAFRAASDELMTRIRVLLSTIERKPT